jgi:plasmid stabilization system protein ParE
VSRRAEKDLERLFDFLCEENPAAAESALGAIRSAFALLSFSPFSCRKARSDLPRHRELVISFGRRGYIALFEINNSNTVTILTVRHQREDDLW